MNNLRGFTNNSKKTLIKKIDWKADSSFICRGSGHRSTKVERSGVKVTWGGATTQAIG